MRPKTVVLTQPYVAQYRVPLLNRVNELLARERVGFQVFAGVPGRQQAMRRDAAPPLGYAFPLRSRTITVGERHVEWRSLPQWAGAADVLVTELSAQNSIGWRYAMGRKVPCVLWGHGKTYTHRSSGLSTELKVRLTKLAVHAMLYSEGGRDHLVRRGVPRPQLTVIGNATDSGALRAHVSTVTEAAKSELRRALDIDGRQNVALFAGGLDGDKRIDFLLEAASLAAAIDPSFCLLVVGRGRLEDDVRRCQAAGAPVRWLGSAGPDLLARAGALSRCIWMPGRIGLIAVDGLVMRLPVHTTPFAFHAPEADLLLGPTKVVFPDDPAAFANGSLAAMAAPVAIDWPEPPTVEDVAQNFVRVVLRYV